MRAPEIACVILASGLSERFGEADKLQANLCGRSVLSYVLETARAVGFGEIFCVSRSESFDGVTSVKNENPEYGQGHALRLGLGAARMAGRKNCAVLLGDMPLVNDAYVKRIIEKYNTKQCVVSRSKTIRMPPAIFNSAAIETILSQFSTSGAREIFDMLNPAVMDLDDGAALDIDTPEDLARVARIMKARST